MVDFWVDYVLEVKGNLVRMITGRHKKMGAVQVLASTPKGHKPQKSQTHILGLYGGDRSREKEHG